MQKDKEQLKKKTQQKIWASQLLKIEKKRDCFLFSTLEFFILIDIL